MLPLVKPPTSPPWAHWATRAAICGLLGGCDRDSAEANLDGEGSSSTTLEDSGLTTSSGTVGSSSGPEPTGPEAMAPKYDVAEIPDAPPPFGCQGTDGEEPPQQPLFSYIWIVNSGQGTVSKIDTTTLKELGRYRTHPGYGDPSRTSVSLAGDVAVANREGGLVKFFARINDCVDRNGNGIIDTSTGPDDVLAWDEEECRAWFTPFDYTSQRPVAWAPGVWNPSSCRFEDEKVWTAGAHDDASGFAGVHVLLIDGETGMMESMVEIPEVVAGFYGLYGGAADAAGNFWGSQLGLGDLVRVDRETLEYTLWPQPTEAYGITVDGQGRVWTCDSDAARFSPDTETWDLVTVGGSGGCMVDQEGVLWMGGVPLLGVDTNSMQLVSEILLPRYVHGISVDFHGYVWAIDLSDSAYRVDPDTGYYEVVDGLELPYTYSDMTGFALANAGAAAPAG
jgi:hypothetical protein